MNWGGCPIILRVFPGSGARPIPPRFEPFGACSRPMEATAMAKAKKLTKKQVEHLQQRLLRER